MTTDAGKAPAHVERMSTRRGEAALRRDIEADRRSEYRLLYKTAIALAFVAAIAIVRQAFFS
jgi:hypothetical protein